MTYNEIKSHIDTVSKILEVRLKKEKKRVNIVKINIFELL